MNGKLLPLTAACVALTDVFDAVVLGGGPFKWVMALIWTALAIVWWVCRD